MANQANWERDEYQFPRLLAEINATQDKLDMKALCESMDLEPADVNELFDRAIKAWEKIKKKTTAPYRIKYVQSRANGSTYRVWAILPDSEHPGVHVGNIYRHLETKWEILNGLDFTGEFFKKRNQAGEALVARSEELKKRLAGDNDDLCPRCAKRNTHLYDKKKNRMECHDCGMEWGLKDAT